MDDGLDNHGPYYRGELLGYTDILCRTLLTSSECPASFSLRAN